MAKLKRFVSVVLSATLAFGAVGCSKGQTPKNGKEGEKTPVLKVFMPGPQQKDLKLVLDEVNKITEKKIGAKIDMSFIDDGAYTEKMNMKLATKEKFDICFTGYINPYATGVDNEVYYPLTELIDRNCPELWKEMPDFWWDAVRRNGEIYAVPNQQVATTVPALTMDRKWADKYNFDWEKVSSVDDIEPFLQTIKDNEPDYYPTRPYGNYWIKNYEGITTGVGIDLREKGLKAIYQWDAEGFMEGLGKIREWFEKGYFRSDIASVMNDETDFKAGKYVVTGTGWKPGFEATQNAMLGGDNIAMKINRPTIGTATLIATMYAVSKYSDNPDYAIKFINLVNTDKDVYNLLAHGIEGKHYTWVDDKHIKLNENGGYYVNASWKFGNQFNAYLLEGQDENVWEETVKFNETADRSRLIGFLFSTENVQTEISQIATVNKEYKNMLNNGSADYKTYFKEYKKKMMDAGIENVLKEVQRQLDEFSKKSKEN